jgi:N-acetylmuramoyl-L-alanine amidase
MPPLALAAGLKDRAKMYLEGSTMSTTYEIQQGDSVDSVAFAHGLFALTVWNDPGNAELRKKRKNRNVLLPGDSLVIPDKRSDPKDCATDKRHVFRRRGIPAKYRLQVLYQGQPVKNAAYRLVVDKVPYEGTTDGNGFLEEFVPADSRKGALLVHLAAPDPPLVCRIMFGFMDPIDSLTGMEKRLNNLGYIRRVPGHSQVTRVWNGLRRLQRDFDLPITGKPDEKSLACLESLQDTGKLIPQATGDQESTNGI